MKVLVFTPDFGWPGGVDLLHGFVKGLLFQKIEPCEVFLLIRSNVTYKPTGIKHLARRSIKRSIHLVNNIRLAQKRPVTDANAISVGDEYSQQRNIEDVFAGENVRYVYVNDLDPFSFNKVLDEISPDIIFPVLNNSFDANFRFPWIGYLFDFVYRYHSELYTRDFCLDTDMNYLRTLKNAKAVIVNSKSVLLDIKKFIPYAKSKVYNLPFAPFLNEEIYEKAKGFNDVCGKYEMRNPFFIVSNQFWLHKSHETAFRALKKLNDRLPDANIHLIVTGRMTDLTGTDKRMNELKAEIRTLDLEDRIHFLGHIPKLDQMALMLRSLAVVQPTLFEGGPGGGSVYMGVAIGVKCIVSDIPVNQEIVDEPLVNFFKAGDDSDLAEKMRIVYQERPLNPTAFNAVGKSNQRLAAVGEVLIDCFRHTIEKN